MPSFHVTDLVALPKDTTPFIERAISRAKANKSATTLRLDSGR